MKTPKRKLRQWFSEATSRPESEADDRWLGAETRVATAKKSNSGLERWAHNLLRLDPDSRDTGLEGSASSSEDIIKERL